MVWWSLKNCEADDAFLKSDDDDDDDEEKRREVTVKEIQITLTAYLADAQNTLAPSFSSAYAKRDISTRWPWLPWIGTQWSLLSRQDSE